MFASQLPPQLCTEPWEHISQQPGSRWWGPFHPQFWYRFLVGKIIHPNAKTKPWKLRAFHTFRQKKTLKIQGISYLLQFFNIYGGSSEIVPWEGILICFGMKCINIYSNYHDINMSSNQSINQTPYFLFSFADYFLQLALNVIYKKQLKENFDSQISQTSWICSKYMGVFPKKVVFLPPKWMVSL